GHEIPKTPVKAVMPWEGRYLTQGGSEVKLWAASALSRPENELAPLHRRHDFFDGLGHGSGRLGRIIPPLFLPLVRKTLQALPFLFGDKAHHLLCINSRIDVLMAFQLFADSGLERVHEFGLEILSHAFLSYSGPSLP